MSDFTVDYTRYQLNRGWLRKFVRRLYLNNFLKYIQGKTIDFGCGVGELLKLLPRGSIGYEINEATVNYCNSIGLPVRIYKPEIDTYRFKEIHNNEFNTLIMSHVLEHCDNADTVVGSIVHACAQLNIKRIIIAVPGPKGYSSDRTHKSYIDEAFFAENIEKMGIYTIVKTMRFPFNCAWVGKIFPHNELIVICDKKA